MSLYQITGHKPYKCLKVSARFHCNLEGVSSSRFQGHSQPKNIHVHSCHYPRWHANVLPTLKYGGSLHWPIADNQRWPNVSLLAGLSLDQRAGITLGQCMSINYNVRPMFALYNFNVRKRSCYMVWITCEFDIRREQYFIFCDCKNGVVKMYSTKKIVFTIFFTCKLTYFPFSPESSRSMIRVFTVSVSVFWNHYSS